MVCPLLYSSIHLSYSLTHLITLPALHIPLQPTPQARKGHRLSHTLTTVIIIQRTHNIHIRPEAARASQMIFVAVVRYPVLPVAVSGPVLAGADVDAGDDFFDYVLLSHGEGAGVDVPGDGFDDWVAEEVGW